MTIDLLLTNTRIYTRKGLADCSLAVDNGRIFKMGKEVNMPKADKRLDLKGLLVLPGLIDAHVHLRDEGKAHKEDFYSGTAAAAAGGITTVLDMPNNEPVTMNSETLKNRMKNAGEKILVNAGFYSEFPKSLREIEKIAEEGAVAFKLYMAEQVGGLNIDSDDALLEAFKIVNRMGLPVSVHAEDKSVIKSTEKELKNTNSNNIEAFLKAHSENAEVIAVKRLLSLAKKANLHMHFCHVSTKDGLKAIIDGKKSKIPVTCEATPHHLFLSESSLKQAGTMALTMPPIRKKPNSVALWSGIRDRWVDVVASDHAPHTLEEKKTKLVWNVKVGIPGLETTLPLLLTAVNNKKLSLADIARLMAEKPAEIFKLKDKGYITEGKSADLTIIDLKRKHKIDASKFHSKAKYSPFDQKIVTGKPVKTFVSGQLIMDDGEIVAKAGSGKIIRRK